MCIVLEYCCWVTIAINVNYHIDHQDTFVDIPSLNYYVQHITTIYLNWNFGLNLHPFKFLTQFR